MAALPEKLSIRPITNLCNNQRDGGVVLDRIVHDFYQLQKKAKQVRNEPTKGRVRITWIWHLLCDMQRFRRCTAIFKTKMEKY